MPASVVEPGHAELRQRILDEEVDELRSAVAKNDIMSIADALLPHRRELLLLPPGFQPAAGKAVPPPGIGRLAEDEDLRVFDEDTRDANLHSAKLLRERRLASCIRLTLAKLAGPPIARVGHTLRPARPFGG